MKKSSLNKMSKSSLKQVHGGSGAGRFAGRMVGAILRYGGGYIGGVNFVTDYARYRAMQ